MRYYAEYFMYEVSCFPLHFMLYRGNLDYFLDSVVFKRNSNHCYLTIVEIIIIITPWAERFLLSLVYYTAI